MLLSFNDFSWFLIPTWLLGMCKTNFNTSYIVSNLWFFTNYILVCHECHSMPLMQCTRGSKNCGPFWSWLWAVLYLRWAVLDVDAGRFKHVKKLWAVLVWAVLVLGLFGIDPQYSLVRIAPTIERWPGWVDLEIYRDYIQITITTTTTDSYCAKALADFLMSCMHWGLLDSKLKGYQNSVVNYLRPVNSNSRNIVIIWWCKNSFGCSTLNYQVFSSADIPFRVLSTFTTKPRNHP